MIYEISRAMLEMFYLAHTHTFLYLCTSTWEKIDITRTRKKLAWKPRRISVTENFARKWCLAKSSCVNSKHLQNQLLAQVQLPNLTVLHGAVALTTTKAYSTPYENHSNCALVTVTKHIQVCQPLSSFLISCFCLNTVQCWMFSPKNLAKGVFSRMIWHFHTFSWCHSLTFAEKMKTWRKIGSLVYSHEILVIPRKTLAGRPLRIATGAPCGCASKGHQGVVMTGEELLLDMLDELPGWSRVEHRPAGAVLSFELVWTMGIFDATSGVFLNPGTGLVGRVWKSRPRVLAEFWDEPAAIQAMAVGKVAGVRRCYPCRAPPK